MHREQEVYFVLRCALPKPAVNTIMRELCQIECRCPRRGSLLYIWSGPGGSGKAQPYLCVACGKNKPALPKITKGMRRKMGKALEVLRGEDNQIHKFKLTREEITSFNDTAHKFGWHSVVFRVTDRQYTKYKCRGCGGSTTDMNFDPDWCRCRQKTKGRSHIITNQHKWRAYVKVCKMPFPGCSCQTCVDLFSRR